MPSKLAAFLETVPGHFGVSIRRTLSPQIEGGESNDAADTGGPTNAGLAHTTIRDLRWSDDPDHLAFDFDGDGDVDVIDVHAIPDHPDAVVRWYRQRCWNMIRGDDLPWPLNYLTFDAAVNHGNDPAARILQRCLRVSVDGVIGSRVTIPAALRADKRRVIQEYIAVRSLLYSTIIWRRYVSRIRKGWSEEKARAYAFRFALGWHRRTSNVSLFALEHAEDTAPVVGSQEDSQ
jgi:lysozyme family protein